jgi:1-acyl-sn-glycerol-3-phosphate acyltransferase
MSYPLQPVSGRGNGWVDRLTVQVRIASECLVFYGVLAAFGLGCLLWSLPAAVLHFLLPRHSGTRLGQFAIMAGFRCFVALMKSGGIIKCDLAALDALRCDTSIVIAPNHPSMLDAVLVISRLPRVVCIMKARIWDNLFLGGGARLASYIRNDTPMDMVRQAVEEVRAGNPLLIFPEGTRTVQLPLNRFKGGFALIAKLSGAPVQTVFIETNSPYLCKGWSVFRKPPRFPLTYSVRLGRRFEPQDDVAAFVAELEQYYAREMGAAELRQPAVSPRPPPVIA